MTKEKEGYPYGYVIERMQDFLHNIENFKEDDDPMSVLAINSQKRAVVRILLGFANTKPTKDWEEEVYGYVECNYDDIADASDGRLTSKSAVSTIMRELEGEGHITRIRRGNPFQTTIWDIRNLMDKYKHEFTSATVKEEAKPEVAINVVRTPAAVETQAPTKQLEATLEEPKVNDGSTDSEKVAYLQSSLQEMISYIQELPNQMVGHLQSIVSELDLLDRNEYDKTVEQVNQLKTQRDFLNQENEKLHEKANKLEEELKTRPTGPQFNQHLIYRQRNQILDEIERYIATPGWQKNHKSETFRKTINTSLDTIMKEVGATDGQE